MQYTELLIIQYVITRKHSALLCFSDITVSFVTTEEHELFAPNIYKYV